MGTAMTTPLEVAEMLSRWRGRSGWRGLVIEVAGLEGHIVICMTAPGGAEAERILPEGCHTLKYQKFVDVLASQMLHEVLDGLAQRRWAPHLG